MDVRILIFESEARRFCALVEDDAEDNSWIFAQKCLASVLRVYERALQLPPAEAPRGYEFLDRADMDSWNIVMRRVGTKLTQDFYWMVHEPLEPFGQANPEAVIGQISDDLADIWRDLKRGLQELDRGGDTAITAGVWLWRFLFEKHWGKHASTAILALHALCFGPFADASRPIEPDSRKVRD
jgi:hypothetical protein